MQRCNETKTDTTGTLADAYAVSAMWEKTRLQWTLHSLQ